MYKAILSVVFLYWFRTEFSGGKTSDIDIDDSLDCAKKTQPKQPCKHALNETKWTSRNRCVDCKSCSQDCSWANSRSRNSAGTASAVMGPIIRRLINCKNFKNRHYSSYKREKSILWKKTNSSN